MFAATGSMVVAREDHAATLLANGKVLVVGGGPWGGSSTASNTAEVYDPTAGTFAATGSIPTPAEFRTATLLANGKVLVAGGKDISTNYFRTAALYDPATGTFAATGSMISVRASYTATALPNRTVLVAGGDDGRVVGLSAAELYVY